VFWDGGLFVAHHDIDPTEDWQIRIKDELLEMDGLVALMKQGFEKSVWCQQEVGAAVGRKVPFISIKQGIDPPGLVSKYQALEDNGKSSSQLAKEICEVFLTKPGIGPKITASLVQQLDVSTNYDRSCELVTLIKDSSHITADVKEHMQSIAKRNNQVYDAYLNWGTPSSIALTQVIDNL